MPTAAEREEVLDAVRDRLLKSSWSNFFRPKDHHGNPMHQRRAGVVSSLTRVFEEGDVDFPDLARRAEEAGKARANEDFLLQSRTAQIVDLIVLRGRMAIVPSAMKLTDGLSKRRKV